MNPLKQNQDGESALMCAIAMNDTQIVDTILRSKHCDPSGSHAS